ncbi:MAG: DUF1810 domain-containing protein [Paracoccaceae bacterium]
MQRFLDAQDGTHAQALAELRAGRKVTHWIWWEMPQLASLGRSSYARDYGIADLDEAAAYLAHPTLRARLIELCDALLDHKGEDPERILGDIDALKVRSMATLFAAVPNAPTVFADLLDTFYNGDRCPLTLAEL